MYNYLTPEEQPAPQSQFDSDQVQNRNNSKEMRVRFDGQNSNAGEQQIKNTLL